MADQITMPSLMELQLQQQAIERQRQIAQLLQSQSLQPADGQMVSGHYVAPSPMQYAAKLGQALSGASLHNQLDQKQLDVVRNYADNQTQLAQSLIGGAPAPQQTGVPNMPLGSGMSGIGDSQPVSTPAATTAPAPSGVNPLFKGMNPQLLGAFLQSPDSAFGKMAFLQMQTNAKGMEPTELGKTLTLAGIDPSSPLGRQIAQQNIAKTNYMAPESHRAGSFARDPVTGKTTFYPQIPEGGAALFDQNGNPAGVTELPGASGVIGRVEAAKLRGKNSQTLASPEYSPTLPNGQIVPTSVDATLNGPQGLDLTKLSPSQISALQKADPEAFTRGVAHFNGVGPSYGQKEGAVNAQTELSKKWTDLTAQNQQAQTTNSYLQNIKSLASKAATGQGSDKINLANGLLSLVGSDSAKDAVTANNLLDKYSNQIVARLGQGGLGTDAARSILQSAYPNAHMTKEAIHEAADNLIGANSMVQAKARLLAPYANSRDASKYNDVELRFDQNADPRIFQYANIQDPAQRQAFAKKIIQQDPKILQKIKNLEALGAL